MGLAVRLAPSLAPIHTEIDMPLLLVAQMTDAPAAGALASWFDGLPAWGRVLVVILLAALAHLAVKLIRRVGEWVVTPAESPRLARLLVERRQPKVATLTILVVSAATFTIYFVALGFALRELTPITLGQFFASATVIGLAVGFGTQGLVQDVVTGLTLIFSDTMNVGDVMEVSGQIGRVERIGLRFTVLTNFVGQTVMIPNRNIGALGRYPTGYARAFLDVQIPAGIDEATVRTLVGRIARGVRAQHPGVIVGEPRIHAAQRAGEEGWPYLRTRFRIWPGQQALIETAVRQRVLAAMRELEPAFADWMVTVTYRMA
jgi:moderate conductance mechanosensitive channel